MAITREEIRRWINRGKKEGATHVVVMCDTFHYEDYPVFIKSGQDAKQYMIPQNMQRAMECYDLSLDIEEQLNEHRAFHWPK